MNKQVLKQWIDALRSEEYQQGRHRLRKNDAFCCLGVLCDISKLGSWDSQDRYRISGVAAVYKDIPPSYVSEWLESSQTNILIEVGYLKRKFPTASYLRGDFMLLSEINDAGAPFSVIADILEDILEERLVSKGYSTHYAGVTV